MGIISWNLSIILGCLEKNEQKHADVKWNLQYNWLVNNDLMDRWWKLLISAAILISSYIQNLATLLHLFNMFVLETQTSSNWFSMFNLWSQNN